MDDPSPNPGSVGGKSTDHPTSNALDPRKFGILDALKRSNCEKGFSSTSSTYPLEACIRAEKPFQTLVSEYGLARVEWQPPR